MARNGRVPPHNVEAEAALLGAMLLSPQAVMDIAEIGLTADDFYKPYHQITYAAIQVLVGRGERPDAVAVAEELRQANILTEVGGPGFLLGLQTDTPAISNARRYAAIVRRTALLRRMIQISGDLSEMAYDEPDDLNKITSILLDAQRMIETGDGPSGVEMPEDFFTYDEMASKMSTRTEASDWVIPWTMRRRWRALLVAPEGSAKSLILRQIVLLCAAGWHPFSPQVPMRPCRTLTIDVENPLEVVEHQFAIIKKVTGIDTSDGRAMIWAREEGLNLRKRPDQALFEAVIMRAKPDLVTLGPLYKLGLREGDDWDEAAGELQQFLDKMRVRHNFALLLEHHPPGANSSDGKRQIRPFGSSAWLRWPEFGIRFVASEVNAERQPTILKVDHWRPPRLNGALWPEKLRRSERGAPWVGEWPNGTFKDSPSTYTDPEEA